MKNSIFVTLLNESELSIIYIESKFIKNYSTESFEKSESKIITTYQ